MVKRSIDEARTEEYTNEELVGASKFGTETSPMVSRTAISFPTHKNL